MGAYRHGRMLVLWGRGLFFGGLAGLAVSAAPALLLTAVPADPGFFGTLAALLILSVTPLMAVAASAGAILLLAGAVRGWFDRS